MKPWLAVAGAMAVASLAACSSSPPVSHTATLAADERPNASLDVLTGTAALKIGVADFGVSGALLRVSTPASGPAPRLWEVSANGATRQGPGTIVDLSASGASAVTVTLNAAVRWRLVLAGGTTRTTADLRGGQVTGIAFRAGSDVISLALPQPHGNVPVQLAGGASQLLLSLPAGVPVRMTAAGGAGEVSLEGQDHSGVAGGSVFTTPGWAPGAAGLDIAALAGAGRIAVTARAS